MKELYPDVGIAVLCKLFGRSAQAFYAKKKHQEKRSLHKGIVLDLIHQIRVKVPRIGGRKLFYMLQDDLAKHQIKMGRDAFFDFLREQDLLVRPKRKHHRTTNSHHRFKKYNNLIVNLVVEEPNRLWVSDITYIDVNNRWAYVIFITDAYSHKVVGFNVADKMTSEFCLVALDQAIAQWHNREKPLIHHSDRGVQYCSDLYTKRLLQEGIQISMTQNGDPRENPVAERVNGIFKGDFLMDRTFESIELAQTEIAQMVESYNGIRPHSSCDYLTPEMTHRMKGPLKKRWKPKSY